MLPDNSKEFALSRGERDSAACAIAGILNEAGRRTSGERITRTIVGRRGG